MQCLRSTTESVGQWTEEEQMLFNVGVIAYGWGNWKEISEIIPTRTNTQVKSHAQKFKGVQRLKTRHAEHTKSMNEIKQMAGNAIKTGTRGKSSCGKRKSGPLRCGSAPTTPQTPSPAAEERAAAAVTPSPCPKGTTSHNLNSRAEELTEEDNIEKLSEDGAPDVPPKEELREIADAANMHNLDDSILNSNANEEAGTDPLPVTGDDYLVQHCKEFEEPPFSKDWEDLLRAPDDLNPNNLIQAAWREN